MAGSLQVKSVRRRFLASKYPLINRYIYVVNSLNPGIAQLLSGLGVEVLEDLDTLFESTDDLLEKTRKTLSEDDFRHLVKSYKHFKGGGNETASWLMVDRSVTKTKNIGRVDDGRVVKKARRIAGYDILRMYPFIYNLSFCCVL